MAARVSVIISTYNRRSLLKDAVRSVLNQSMPDFEIIVVDDCSPDTLAVQAMVEGFLDPRIKFIRTDKNYGHDGHPKNLGVLAATGEYVAFLDDDDTYRREALKILLAYAKESKCDVVYGDYLIDGQPGWSVDFSVSRLSQHNYISMVVALVRREAFLKVGGFDEAVPKFKDWNLWLRMQKGGASFMHVPIIITEVKQLKDSISSKFENEKDENGRYKPTFFNPADCMIYPEQTCIGPRKPLRIALYTLTMDRLEYTKKMYEGIKNLAGYPFDWYVIDQGSTDGTQEWIKKLTRDYPPYTPGNTMGEGGWRLKLRYRLYAQNVGLAKGWNNIIEFIKSEEEYDVIIKVDNDAEMLTEGWLKSMVEVFERNRKVCLSPYVEGLEGSPGGVLRQRASGDSPYMMINDKVLGLVPHLGGIVYATPVELWKGFKFDEEYEGNKDYLLSQYANKQGLALFYMEEFRVWHIDGTEGQHKKYPDYFKGRSDIESVDEEE